MKKLIQKILILIGCIVLLSCPIMAANTTTISEKTYKSYQTVVNENQFFISMIGEIFSVQEDISEENSSKTNYFNIDSTLDKLTSVAIEALKKWGDSALYFLFIGLGVFILLVKATISITDTYSKEKRTIQQNLKVGISVLIAIIIITNVNNLVVGLLTFFRFITINVMEYVKSGEAMNIPQIQAFTKSEMIAYNILKGVGADSNSIVDQALNSNGQAMLLTIKYLVPWLVCVAGKVGVTFAIILAELEILVNGMMYPIAAGDCFENLKRSSFMLYTKKILASMLRLVIIILVVLGTQVLFNGYINELLESASKIYTEGVTRAKSEEIFNIALILSAIQLGKTILAISVSSAISKRVIGIVE